ncbi:MAG: alpha/beta fold hydrolase [Alphaproteobacteria bacterium]
MPVLDVNGDRLHYLDEGAGRPVIFVHGSCGGAGQWNALSTRLQESYRTICLDLFGSGQSEPWPIKRPWTVEDDSRAIRAVLERIEGPVHLVAHSGGGHFAYPTLSEARDRILSVTLLEPVYFHLLRQDGDPLFEEPREMSAAYRAAIGAGRDEAAIEGFVDKWVGPGAWRALPDRVKAIMRSSAGRLYYEWSTLDLEAPGRDDLATLDVPVLLIKGSRTIASMHRICEIVARTLPECRYETIEGAGHMSPFTHVERVAPLIAAHLAAASRSGPARVP